MSTSSIYRIAWFVYLALAVAGAVWVGVREGVISGALFFDPQEWWIDLALGVAGAALLLGVWRLMRVVSWDAQILEQRIGDVLGKLSLTDAVALALISGFAEELFFRAAVQGSWGLPVATLAFALLHFGPGPEYRWWMLFALVAGGLLGGLMAWRQNLLAPVVAHAGVNAINLVRIARASRASAASEDGESGS